MTRIESLIRRQGRKAVLTGDIEGIDKTVLANHELVEIDGAVEPVTLISNTRDRHRSIPSQLALQAQIPLVHIGCAEIQVNPETIPRARGIIVEIHPVPRKCIRDRGDANDGTRG